MLGVDGHGEWFRYHRLFAKLLRTRAERELGRELPRLHARAARWYAEQRRWARRRIEHAVAAEEWDLALELVAGHWFELYVRGQGDAVRSLTAHNSFGESWASRRSLVPTGLAEGLSLGGVPPGGGVPTGGALPADGSAPPAGRAGSGDLPAHAHASKTTAMTVARIGR